MGSDPTLTGVTIGCQLIFNSIIVTTNIFSGLYIFISIYLQHISRNMPKNFNIEAEICLPRLLDARVCVVVNVKALTLLHIVLAYASV